MAPLQSRGKKSVRRAFSLDDYFIGQARNQGNEGGWTYAICEANGLDLVDPVDLNSNIDELRKNQGALQGSLIAVLQKSRPTIKTVLVENIELLKSISEPTLLRILQSLKETSIAVWINLQKATTTDSSIPHFANVCLENPARTLASIKDGKPNIVPKDRSPMTRPRWLNRSGTVETFDKDGVWICWIVLREYFEGSSFRDIANKLTGMLPVAGKTSRDEKSGRVRKTYRTSDVESILKSERLSPRSEANDGRLYLIPHDVGKVMAEAILARSSPAQAGRPSKQRKLFKGIDLRCPHDNPISVGGKSSCPKTECITYKKNAPEIQALFCKVLREWINSSSLIYWELVNPFCGTMQEVHDCVDEVNAKFIQKGTSRTILLEKVHQKLKQPPWRKLDFKKEVIELLCRPSDKLSEQDFTRLRLVVLRRFQKIRLVQGPTAITRRSNTGAMHAITADDMLLPHTVGHPSDIHAVVTLKPKVDAVDFDQARYMINTRVHVHLSNRFQIKTDPSLEPEFKEWANHSLAALANIHNNPTGLGSSFLEENEGMRPVGKRNDALPDAVSEWINQVNTSLGQRELMAIELKERPTTPAEHEAIDDLLGAYRRRDKRATIILYPRAIRWAAKKLSCDEIELLKIVITHEVGHHADSSLDVDSGEYNRDSSNSATCRIETVACMFSWLTADDSGRATLEKLNMSSSTPYQVYRFLLANSSMESKSAAAGKLGWLAAWQLSQHPRQAYLTIPRDALSRVDQAALLGSVDAANADFESCSASVWPLFAGIRTSLSLVSESTSDALCVEQWVGAFSRHRDHPLGWYFDYEDTFRDFVCAIDHEKGEVATSRPTPGALFIAIPQPSNGRASRYHLMLLEAGSDEDIKSHVQWVGDLARVVG